MHRAPFSDAAGCRSSRRCAGSHVLDSGCRSSRRRPASRARPELQRRSRRARAEARRPLRQLRLSRSDAGSVSMTPQLQPASRGSVLAVGSRLAGRCARRKDPLRSRRQRRALRRARPTTAWRRAASSSSECSHSSELRLTLSALVPHVGPLLPHFFSIAAPLAAQDGRTRSSCTVRRLRIGQACCGAAVGAICRIPATTAIVAFVKPAMRTIGQQTAGERISRCASAMPSP